MGPFEVRVGGEADLAAALGELWGSVEGGCSSAFLLLYRLGQSQDSQGVCREWHTMASLHAWPEGSAGWLQEARGDTAVL